jgi:hypothetical protein
VTRKTVNARISRGAFLFDHLAADGTGLTAGQFAVVTVLQVDADFRSGFHLELIHGLAGSGVYKMIAGIGRHVSISFDSIWVIARAYLLRLQKGYSKKIWYFIFTCDRKEGTIEK